MSDKQQELDSAIEYFETKVLGRQFTAQERIEFRRAYRATVPKREFFRLAYDPIAMAQLALEFTKSLKNRQGTITPDFEELFRRKAEFDRKLSDP